MRTLFFTLGFVFSAMALLAQDCQQVSLQLEIPAGVTKHHFPVQELPFTDADKYFTYLAAWDQGELVVRLRFSEDGETWTKWQVLKRDFRDPNAKMSPLNIGEVEYRYFEWAVFNKAGLESELTFNFYHPSQTTILADVGNDLPYEISTCTCPEPELAAAAPVSTSIVTINQDDE